MNIQFYGAAQTVTGSCFVISACGIRFAVDCGMHQGNSEIDARNQNTDEYRAADWKFILLTHAHIDHSGLLPRVTADGFKGQIYCTAPTADLLSIMLEDSAHIQEVEAEWKRKKSTRHADKSIDTSPLYTMEDAQKAVSLCSLIEYNKSFTPHDGIKVTYYDAGHILGSAMLEISITENGKTSNLLFSGDLGRPGMLLMHDPAEPSFNAQYIFMESTYGDRNHKNETDTLNELADAVAYSSKLNDKVLIPSFAIGRTQEILYCLYLLNQQGRLPNGIPIFVDSPLAAKATDIFRKYKKLLDTPEINEFAADVRLRLPNIQFTLTAADSQKLNELAGPAIIIAGSGMCNAGRIRHHIRHNAWRKSVSLVFVGYQGIGTPGRKIIDGAKILRMFNEDVAISAKIYTLGGFSAHAGQSQMLEWLGKVKSNNTQVILIHGEEKAQKIFAEKIKAAYDLPVYIPGYMEEMELTSGVEQHVVQISAPVSESCLNWDILVTDTETKLAQLKALIEQIKAQPWDKQIELRDRLLELNKDMLSLLMYA